MVVEALTTEPPAKSTFPLERVTELLRQELEEATDESVICHGGWEPVLDSLRMVTIIITLEDMFDFPLPPEKVVRKGGYKSADEAFDNTVENLRKLWDKYHK